jgi:hypothetical protein
MRILRRHELANITTLGDVNELAISGHVEHEPRLREGDDRGCVCEFVLTHTTTSPWEQQRYNVQAYGELAEYYATSWQPGQAIVINGRLEHHLCDTLTGPPHRLDRRPLHRRHPRSAPPPGAQRVMTSFTSSRAGTDMATPPLAQDSHRQARQHTLLIATTDPDQRAFLAAQLDADGHTVYEANSSEATIAKLSAHAIDVMVLGRLHRPADAPALLRAIRPASTRASTPHSR